MIGAGLQFGKYEVGERLGKGGFGIVFRARDRELGREIAIKFLKPEYLMRPQIAQRFLNEARAAATIGHPGIVTVFECGLVDGTSTRDDGTAFIAMELLRGESLADVGRVSVDAAMSIIRQLASALAAAHAAGIVHRDLKPDNVFVLEDAAAIGGMRVKLLDFGIAKLAEPGEDGVHTHSQMILGTPRYMSPEQARSSKHIDHRSDIYALGCMFYELLCGHSPFSGDHGEQIMQHQTAPPPSPRAKLPTLDPALDALVVAMLAKSPADRPQTMLDIERQLATYAPAATITGTAPPAPRDQVEEVTTVAHASTTRPRSRRGVVAAIAGLAVAGGVVAAVLITRGSSTPPPPSVAAIANDAAELPVDVDAAPIPEAPPIDGASVPDDRAMMIHADCLDFISRRKWADLNDCADKLEPHDLTRARELKSQANAEARAEVHERELRTAIVEGRKPAARAAFARIPPTSVYHAPAKEALDAAYPPTSVAVAPRPAEPKPTPTPERPAPSGCDADKLMDQGQQHINVGAHAAALVALNAAYQCKPSSAIANFAFLAACVSKNSKAAKLYYPRISAKSLYQRCRDTGTAFE